MPIWSKEFEDPVFTLAAHPEKHEFVVGFGSGRVTAFKYTYDSEPEELWSAKRHKSSCRGVAYSQDGQYVFTAGSDNIIKKARAGTGKVVNKAEIPGVPSAFTINSHFIYIGDDDGNMCVLDLDLNKKYEFEEVVPDCVNSITAMEFKNQYHVLVTGMSTLTHIDIRKGVLTKSEDQEDELLCGAIPNGNQSVFGMSEGILTFWKNDHLLDQQNRLRLSKEGTIDSILSGETEEIVICGSSDGKIFEVDTRSCKILSTVTHASEEEGEEVTMLDWDSEYHLISGSMGKIILWNKGEQDAPVEDEGNGKKKSKRKHKGKNKKGQEAKRSKMFSDL